MGLARRAAAGGLTRDGRSPVSEGSIEDAVRRFGEAFEQRDVEAMLACFAEDAVWVSPVGTFTGNAGLRQVLTWDTQISPTVTFRSSGIGLLCTDRVAVREMTSEGTLPDGKRWDAPAVAVFEFDGEGKIRHLRLYYDKLSIMKRVTAQYTGVTGWLYRKVVDAIVGRAEQGLH
jgi:ketosteroid isomerase-like protein